MSWQTPSTRSTGDLITAAIWNQDVKDNAIALTPSGWTFLLDNLGSEITTGIKGDVEIPFKCDINAVTMLADQSGSIVIDLWVDTYANYPPDNGDSITAAATPTISAATKSQDTTLTGWTTQLNEGDIMRYNVDSCTTITRCSIALRGDRN